MENIVEFNDFSASPDGIGKGMVCWLCHKCVPSMWIFCEKCGAIQSVKQTDHFSRLGIERRFDIDTKLLEQQYLYLKQKLEPRKLSVRGIVERGYAEKNLEALEEAYNTLSDPLLRGRYWLFLHNKEAIAPKAEDSTIINELSVELDNAAEAYDYDRVAQKSGQAMEQGIKNMMQALRTQNWDKASNTLSELDSIETILKKARASRAQLTPDGGANGISSVK